MPCHFCCLNRLFSSLNWNHHWFYATNGRKRWRRQIPSFGYLFLLELNSIKWYLGFLGCVGVEDVSPWKPVQEKKRRKAAFLAIQGKRRDTWEKLKRLRSPHVSLVVGQMWVPILRSLSRRVYCIHKIRRAKPFFWWKSVNPSEPLWEEGGRVTFWSHFQLIVTTFQGPVRWKAWLLRT